MSKDIDIMETNMDLIKSDIVEYRLYIKICAITILFIILIFFGSKSGLAQLKSSLLGQIIILTALIIFGLMFYMFGKIIYLSNFKIGRIIKDRKLLIQNWMK